MFNFKGIKKVVAAAVVLSAIAVYASPSFAIEVNCDGKTGQELKNCEELKALAEKSNAKAAKTKEKADKKAEKAQKKAQAAEKTYTEGKAKRADTTAVEEYIVQTWGKGRDDKLMRKAAKKLVEDVGIDDSINNYAAQVAKRSGKSDIDFNDRQGAIDTHRAYYTEELSKALANGDKDRAEEIQASMIQLNAEEAKNKADAKNAKEAQKAKEKAEKAQEKADRKAEKAADKAEKKIIKAAEKAEKSANKDKEKADKEVKKLQEKCNKDPVNCDMDKLQAALAKQKTAAAAADAAKKQREDVDGTTAAREQAEADKAAAQAAADGASGDDGDVLNAASEADAAGAAEAASAPKRCEGAKGIFEIIACKAITTLADLRTILYIISGFGLIAFAWSAIFNKISWKHFAQICIALFLLSMMGTFIGYFGYDSSYRALKFGQYLEDGYQTVDGSGNIIGEGGKMDCKMLADGTCEMSELTVTAKAAKKWSLKDLKSSIQSGISAVKKVHSVYQTTKATVENVVSNAKAIGNAIKNGEGGLDGILNAMTTVANATGNIMNSGQLLANNIAANVGGISEDIKLAGLSEEQREIRAKTQQRYAELKDQCTTGKCNKKQMAEYNAAKRAVEGVDEKELAALEAKCNRGTCSEDELDNLNTTKAYLESQAEFGDTSSHVRNTGIQNWLNNDSKGGGATIMAGINKVGNIANNVTNSVTKTANAAQNGMAMGNNIGGGVLGNILGAAMGAATGVGEGIGMVGNENFNFKSEGKKREEKAAAEEAAYKASDKYVVAKSKDGKSEVRGDGSTKTTHDNGTVVVTSKDGTKTATTKDGSSVVQNKDGSKVVTNSNGTVTTYDKDGKVVNVDKSNTKVTYGGDASIADLARRTSSSSAKPKGEQKPEAKPKEESKPEAKPKEEPKPEAKPTEESKPEAKPKEDLAERIKVACQKYKTERYRNACMSCVNSKSENDFVDCHAAAVKKVQQQDAINKANQKATADADKEYCEKYKQALTEKCFWGDKTYQDSCKKCGIPWMKAEQAK